MSEIEQAVIEHYRKIKIKRSELDSLEENIKQPVIEEHLKAGQFFDDEMKRINKEYEERKIIIDDKTPEQTVDDYLNDELNFLLSEDEGLRAAYETMRDFGLFEITKKICSCEDKMRQFENHILFFIKLQELSEEYGVRIDMPRFGIAEISLQPEQTVRLRDVSPEKKEDPEHGYYYAKDIVEYEIFRRLPEINSKYLPALKESMSYVAARLDEFDWEDRRKHIEIGGLFINMGIMKKIREVKNIPSDEQERLEEIRKKKKEVEILTEQLHSLENKIEKGKAELAALGLPQRKKAGRPKKEKTEC